MRIANDPTVKKALAIERKSKQLRKKSIVVQAQTVYEHALGKKNTRHRYSSPSRGLLWQAKTENYFLH